MASKAVAYDDNAIKHLSSIDHIRLRPGMYIGRMGNGQSPDDGIYTMLKEVVDNSIDEFIMGHGKKIIVEVTEHTATVRDYGRGIPQGKLVECVSDINTGGKFNDDVFQFSVGLNGVGTKAVNFLSENFAVTSFRDGKYRRARFERGVLVEDESGKTDEPDGTLTEYTPDTELFPKYAFEDKHIKRRMWNYAYLNSGLSIHFNGERIYSKEGLYDLIAEKVDGDVLYDIIHFRDTTIEFAFTHTSDFGESYFSFVNGQYTNDGGTHQSAFREGILKAVQEFSKKNLDGSDVRNGIVGAVAIKLKEPLFESQTKNKLGNTEIRSGIVKAVQDAVVKYLFKHPETAEIMLEKIETNSRMRKEIQKVKKASREKAKQVSLRIPKLKDCKYHLGDKKGRGDESMIFLTEGDSAAGSMVGCRDVETQALFALRGKPLNCFGKKRDLIISNNEFYCIMRALNIEDDIENLRYEKVIIATDADDDGMHIRNLLLTFFLHYFKEVVTSEHLYILETPLYRVRNKEKTIYCYDEDERIAAIEAVGARHEITRFKGLGEISSHEMGQFIGEDMRLQKVEVERMQEVPELLSFFMGSNTPDRREYIVQNLLPG